MSMSLSEALVRAMLPFTPAVMVNAIRVNRSSKDRDAPRLKLAPVE